MKKILISLASAAALAVPFSISAAPKGQPQLMPDFTKGDVVAKDGPHDWTLGPTGARGWIYTNSGHSGEARQILVTAVAKGSPCEPVLSVGSMKADGSNVAFQKAMTGPSLLPEFKGNVAAVATAPFWAEELAAIDEKRAKVKQMAFLLKTKNKNTPNKDGNMTEAEQKEYLKKYEAEIITPEEASKWTRGASNAGYHYLGCAKTLALMGKAFAEATLTMMKEQKR
jgi:hypothetical protein